MPRLHFLEPKEFKTKMRIKCLFDIICNFFESLQLEIKKCISLLKLLVKVQICLTFVRVTMLD
jgi:hypothetical protein